jgi:hypothetical protein
MTQDDSSVRQQRTLEPRVRQEPSMTQPGPDSSLRNEARIVLKNSVAPQYIVGRLPAAAD